MSAGPAARSVVSEHLKLPWLLREVIQQCKQRLVTGCTYTAALSISLTARVR